MAKYTVLAPLVQLKVRDQAGALVYRQFYAGAVLDEDVLDIVEDGLRRHLEDGLIIEEGERVAEVFAVPAGTPTPGQPPNVAVAETGVASTAAQPIPPLPADLLRAAEIDATGDEPFAAESTDRADSDRRLDGQPDGRASESAWRDFHAAQLRAQGVEEKEARERADGMSKADIRAEYR